MKQKLKYNLKSRHLSKYSGRDIFMANPKQTIKSARKLNSLWKNRKEV